MSVRKGALAPASPPGNGCRSVRSVRSVRSLSESGSGSRESISACSVWRLALIDRSNFAAEFWAHRNNTVVLPGFSCPNPIPRPFDTETDSDPDSDLSMPLTLKAWIRDIGPTHLRGEVENATASSAGGSPNPDGNGEVSLGKRLPFRTAPSV
ncbi:MAG: hypothetical protein ACOX52_11015 [Verrucomicrobiota bacterium]